MEIKGSHVLVTGGNSGIGKETARQLVELGAKVVITGRDEEKLNKVAKEIGAIPLLFDISDLKSIYKSLENEKAVEVKTIAMGQGNKTSRIVAWTFLTPLEQKTWRETKWKNA